MRTRGFRNVAMALVLLGGGLVTGAGRAQSPPGPQADHAAEPGGMPDDHGGMMRGHVQRLLDAVGATDVQKRQVEAVWAPLRPQLRAMRDQRQQLAQRFKEVLAAPTIDTQEAERLRQAGVQLIDQISTLVTQGLVGTAQALTPEQRRAVMQLLEQTRGYHHQRSGPPQPISPGQQPAP